MHAWGHTFCTEQADGKNLLCGICFARYRSALKSHEESLQLSVFKSGDNKKFNWEAHCLHHHPWAHATGAMNKSSTGAAKAGASSALTQTTLLSLFKRFSYYALTLPYCPFFKRFSYSY